MYKKKINLEDTMMRLPPQATELEEAVLGACLLDNCFYLISDKIKADYFYLPQHQHVYLGMQNLFGKGMAIDTLTVYQELKLIGNLEDAGGAYGISQLTNKIASTAHIESHALVIKQKYIQRQIISLSAKALESGYNDFTDPLELLNDITTQLLTLSDLGSLKQIESNKQLVDKIALKIATLKTKKGDVIGISTGFTELDKATQGMLTG
jgi:replicative DNA helicase